MSEELNSDKSKRSKNANSIAVGIAIGIGIGTAIGVATNNQSFARKVGRRHRRQIAIVEQLHLQISTADETLQRMGKIDILVNNAGAAWGAPAEDHPVEAWDKVMNLNVRGYFILSQHVAKRSMIPARSGRIINIASIAGLGGNPADLQTIAYNTSKGAVINFTRALGASPRTILAKMLASS